MGLDFFTDQDWYDLGEELNKLDMNRVCQIIDKNHALYLSNKQDELPESVYEIVHDKKLALKGGKNE
jgi:hypothetical protein